MKFIVSVKARRGLRGLRGLRRLLRLRLRRLRLPPERQELVRARRLAAPVLGGVGRAEAEVAGLAGVRGGELLEAVVAGRRRACRHLCCAW